MTRLRESDIDKDKLRDFFGKKLKEYRIEKVLTVGDVARDSNIEDKYINRIERGDRGAGLITLYKLSKRANISIDEVFARIPEDQVLRDLDDSE